MEELEKTEQYIFLEYYIVREGVMRGAILEALKRKAAQGVLVRLMYGNIGRFFIFSKDSPKQMRRLE